MAEETSPKQTLSGQLKTLNQARQAALTNPSYWPTMVTSILPICGTSNPVEIRRWGADFVAEAAATPAVPRAVKEDVCLKILGTLRMLVEEEGLDEVVLKSTILASASVYPLVVKWIAQNAHDTDSWETIQAIKTRILRIWDDALPSVKICCIKFAQRVVLAQTASNGGEQRGSGLDISLTVIPPNHPLLDPRRLEAEATGLLDRMLGILQDNSSDAVMVDSILNTLGVLIRTRPTTSGRIMNTVLNFNPFKLASGGDLTPKTKVLIKSMEKTTRMLLSHVAKRDPRNPMSPRIMAHVEQLKESRKELLEGAPKKRVLPEQPDEAVAAKRQKVEDAVKPLARLEVPPLGPGMHSLGELFTITNQTGLGKFDVTTIPPGMATRISVAALATLPPELLQQAIAGIRDRLTALANAPPPPPPAEPNPQTSPLDVEEDDDEYEPDFYPAEDTEQILNKLDNAPAEVPPPDTVPELPESVNALATLGTFQLPPPPTLDPSAAARVAQGIVNRVWAPIDYNLLEDTSSTTHQRKQKAGLNRLAASSADRDSWFTYIIRIATRSTSGLEDKNMVAIKPEDPSMALIHQHHQQPQPPATLSDAIRERLYNYILVDFRKRLDIAIHWLCEEWYADKLATKHLPPQSLVLHYEKWTLRLFDGILPYITPQDKLLMRFLAEIPELNPTLLRRVKLLCRDPSTVGLSLSALLYMIMVKPPAKEMAIDVVGEIWVEYEDARPTAARYLAKYRPGYLETLSAGVKGLEGGAVAVAT